MRALPAEILSAEWEQIDGSFQLDHDTYLVEAKWQEVPVGNRELQSFVATVRIKAEWSRGLYVSNSSFSEDGLGRFGQDGNTRIICLAGAELREIFGNKLDLATLLRIKVRRAAEMGRAYIPVGELFKVQ